FAFSAFSGKRGEEVIGRIIVVVVSLRQIILLNAEQREGCLQRTIKVTAFYTNFLVAADDRVKGITITVVCILRCKNFCMAGIQHMVFSNLIGNTNIRYKLIVAKIQLSAIVQALTLPFCV